MSMDAEQRRRLAYAGLDWLRRNPERWNQAEFVSKKGQYCWGGAVLKAAGYPAVSGYFVSGGRSAPAFALLDDLFGEGETGWDTFSEIVGWEPEEHDGAALDELTRRVEDWLTACETNEKEH